ncbi:aminopeptidase [Frateuria sp. Soil773]|uniref:M1 family metallopeptidase n=1 Tax=Frateuria sp. Soil773 TaxID=1736407 RepID=UPI0006FFC1AC|nr:M1 family metallopeptidase [Frateuria sp. Soil773]KRF02354.1 aminopeptidase [Frateuria sp. Soil773]
MRRSFRWLVLFTLALACQAVLATTREDVPLGMLPGWAEPSSYRLDLKIDPRARDFGGRATIQVKLAQATDHLWLHGRSLAVDKVTVTDAAGKAHAARYAEVVPKDGVARIDFGTTLPAQAVTLAIDYRAPFNASLQGLYKVVFDGRAYAMTQMESSNARFAFPGFDEPRFKTPFEIRLTVPDAMVAIANTRQVGEAAAGPGWKTLSFARSQPLPTYLVAIGVGPWDSLQGPDIAADAQRAEPVPLRAFTVQGQAQRARQALQETPPIMQALEDYYGFGYPFGKLDFLATPDFAEGAMENPGLVTFRDWMLLLDDGSSASSVRTVFNTIAHELAHQWTGNLVTLRWWDDIWLNESFAVWMQQKIEARLRPGYRADLEHVLSGERPMASDSLASAGAIRKPVHAVGDPGPNIDGVHNKGAMVIGMFERYVGADVFREGMRTYIRRHRFGTAAAADLIDGIADAAGQDDAFKRAFLSFLDQPGVPLLEARLDASASPAVLHLAQRRYLPPGSRAGADAVWGIPLCVRYGTPAGSRTACSLLDQAQGTMPLPGATAASWVLPNADAAGYYRVVMDRAPLLALGKAVAELSEPEQVGYADIVALAFERGVYSIDDTLAALAPLARSHVREIAQLPLAQLARLREAAVVPAQRARIDAWASGVYQPRLAALGYVHRAGESADDALLRASLAGALGLQLRLPAVRAELARQGSAVLAGDGLLHAEATAPELLATSLVVAVQEQGKPAVDRLMAVLPRTVNPEHRNAILAALAGTDDPQQAERVRDFALGESVKVGEMGYLLGAGAKGTRAQRDRRWQWFTGHYAQIGARMGAFQGGRLAMLAAAGGCSAEEAQRLDAFFRPRLGGASGGLARAEETVELCAARAQRQHADAP